VIVGNGDIASVLNDRTGALIFASGVSNSNCTDELEFQREIGLLRFNAIASLSFGIKCCFYFSTLSINFKVSRYTKHKLEMEDLVKQYFPSYNIIRIGNISWGNNPNTFINYIRNKKAKGEPVEIRDEWKYIISKEQLLLLTDNLPLTGKNEISVFGECKKVIDCL